MDVTIDVLYTCGLCGLEDMPVAVPARGTEDAGAWLRDRVTPLLVADHERRSPGCQPETFTRVKIHIPAGADRLGAPPTH